MSTLACQCPGLEKGKECEYFMSVTEAKLTSKQHHPHREERERETNGEQWGGGQTRD